MLELAWLRAASRKLAGRAGPDALPVLGVTLAAIALRCYLLPGHDVISTDGTGYVGAARQLAAGDLRGFGVQGFYPVLMLLVSLLGFDLETAGRLISVLCGGALPIPLFLLGAALFGRRTALAASLLAAVWPLLAFYSCEVMTQATYIFLVTTGAFLVLQMVRRPSLARGSAAGLCLALVYLTRPEGVLLFFVLPLVPVFQRRADLPLLKRALAAYCLSFLLLSLVNLLLIHEATGLWQLSAKTGSALNDSLVINGRIKGLYLLPPGKAYGYLDVLREYPDFILVTGWNNLRAVWGTLVPIPIWCLALLGVAAGRGKGNSLFLLACCTPLSVLIAFYYVGPEYTQPYLPPLFLLACEGGAALERWLQRPAAALRLGFASRAPLTLLAACIFAGWLLFPQLSLSSAAPYDPDSDDCRRDFKNVGLLLKSSLPPGKLMTPVARIAYYAERERINVPLTGTVAEMLKTARAQGIRFLVFPGKVPWAESGSWEPLFLDLIAPIAPGSRPEEVLICSPAAAVLPGIRLRPFLLYRSRSSKGVVVYEILP